MTQEWAALLYAFLLAGVVRSHPLHQLLVGIWFNWSWWSHDCLVGPLKRWQFFCPCDVVCRVVELSDRHFIQRSWLWLVLCAYLLSSALALGYLRHLTLIPVLALQPMTQNHPSDWLLASSNLMCWSVLVSLVFQSSRPWYKSYRQIAIVCPSNLFSSVHVIIVSLLWLKLGESSS